MLMGRSYDARMNTADACTRVREVSARNIKRRRKEVYLSQQALAEAIGANRTYLSDIETGNGNPSVDMLVKIALGLGVKLTDLIDGADETLLD